MARRRVIFEGDDTSGRQGLWLTNGTVAGTVELAVTTAWTPLVIPTA
jgi:hypothetical protein